MTAHRTQDVVATEAEAAELSMSPLIVTESVRRFLDEHDIGSGPLCIDPIGEGQSNATFRIRRHGADVVLRRGPRPPLPKSTHDMVREARVQAALAQCGFPVPTIRAVESSGSLLGVPFYLMDYLQGDVVTSELPERFAAHERRRELVERTVSTLSGLHSLDVTAGPLSTLGRPDGYLERQVRRFTQLWPQNTLRDLPLMERLSTWLADNRPPTQRHTVIHGDFRIGNLMFANEDHPRVQAVLDWEMATLGDPLADVGYLLATYASRGARPTVMELTTVTRGEGFPNRDEVIKLYSQQSDLNLEKLHWYEVLALWKAAIFCEAIYTRWLQGERPDDAEFSSHLKTGVPELFETAWERTHASPS
ncbi:phosphotransferase family protein [Nesterenkonia sphaerica]|uniref:Phosphotransferase family protein n=1 Tax=Nesterenkonia sphaerica TaxID=1804988 RepID=A0A5R9AMV0_9MICC|nr:phosphotransferase family protein [Nesterenkonia sphaerica]TLP79315.1 phosphotransferase family protein [Nesterenkonia sphaerica]